MKRGEMVDRETLEKLYWDEELSTREIAKKLGCSHRKVQIWMERYGIPRRPRSGEEYPEVELTTKQREILYGLILSDGNLSPRGGNAKFRISSKHLEFILHLRNQFPDSLFPPKWLWRREKDGRISYYLYTICHPLLTELRSLFYPDGEKTIPEIELTPTILLYWFLGDGHRHKSENYILITSGFTYEEYRPVIDWLASEGIEARWKKRDDNGKGILKIYKKESVRRFYELIGPPPVKCFAYKWEGGEER